MSWQPAAPPEAHPDFACPGLETVIVPRSRDLGGFTVGRVLPSTQKRMVGPFVFLDQMGPAELPPGKGLDVRPHPHIGLATVTYLLEGSILHRDSLGFVQSITPGAVNWMTAGRGIVHSERSDDDIRRSSERVFGLQSWVALPKSHEETTPDFVHYAADTLPTLEGEGVNLRLVAGSLFGKTSSVKTFSDLFYADVVMTAGSRLTVPADYDERALYLLSGTMDIAGDRFVPGRLLVFSPGDAITITAVENARFVLLGGEPMDGPRHIWWNFVSSSKDRIEQAKKDWRDGRFEAVPGETEFIPLPETF